MDAPIDRLKAACKVCSNKETTTDLTAPASFIDGSTGFFESQSCVRPRWSSRDLSSDCPPALKHGNTQDLESANRDPECHIRVRFDTPAPHSGGMVKIIQSSTMNLSSDIFMVAARFALAVLAFGSPLSAENARSSTAPSYNIASIVNSASSGAAPLAPNTIATVYGTDLSYNTHAIAASDLRAGVLPVVLGGVQVYVGNYLANLYYVSPHQINFLIPNSLRPGVTRFSIVREGTAGPLVNITLLEVAPSLFELNAETIISTHADGSLITKDAPADGGEVIILYAIGLGRMLPDLPPGQVAIGPAPIQHKDLRVLVGGEAIDANRVLYAGAAPGFAGLYQVNVRLPDRITPNPEVRIAVADQTSKPALKIPTR